MMLWLYCYTASHCADTWSCTRCLMDPVFCPPWKMTWPWLELHEVMDVNVKSINLIKNNAVNYDVLPGFLRTGMQITSGCSVTVRWGGCQDEWSSSACLNWGKKTLPLNNIMATQILWLNLVELCDSFSILKQSFPFKGEITTYLWWQTEFKLQEETWFAD